MENKRNIIVSVIIIAIVIIVGIIGTCNAPKRAPELSVCDTIVTDEIDYDTIKTDWDYIIEAFIEVESKGFDSAKNGDCAGCLQLSSWYWQRGCEIAGRDYPLSDRYDRQKSIEIFNAMNSMYNQNHTLIGACKLHNPEAGSWYYKKVFKTFNKLKEND